ncbi:MAG: NAD(P)/FAD-dependent oxidoreductase [Candidatus Atribacteria bacterium]|nr:NAD(P)/FAD-dependent oxidoreductase [Candidatus Atribacteria bacterium]
MIDKSIIIIGAGFGGLSAGIYAQMNGYHTQIFEMHNLPGGLCTAWKHKGYTIDGCIHWLVGSSPKSGMYRYWEEVGIAQGREFVNAEEFMRYEGSDGRTFTLFTNVDKLEKHLLEFSPQDAKATCQFIQGIRLCLAFDQPSESDPLLKRLQKKLKLGLLLATKGRKMQEWMRITTGEFVKRFQDPVIRGALREMWLPEFSMFFMLFTFAFLHNQNAGYPIGGSLPMSLAMAKRDLNRGGSIHYDSRVIKILVEGNKAIGVRLADGSEHFAGRVISAADGYTTIFKMLDEKYADEETKERYAKWPTFPSLLFVGLGVNRSFANEPQSVSGLSFPLRQPTEIGDEVRDRLSVHIFNQDPTLAPVGKTSLVVMMPSSYEYWKELAPDRTAYEVKKDQVGHTVIDLLNQRFPGISQQVEMVDVATPLTFERYTGNWKGCFEGWLITPQNSVSLLKPMRQTLPGVQNFYMCGQWVEPGGGLPSSLMSARRLVRALCKEDGGKFRTIVELDATRS